MATQTTPGLTVWSVVPLLLVETRTRRRLKVSKTESVRWQLQRLVDALTVGELVERTGRTHTLCAGYKYRPVEDPRFSTLERLASAVGCELVLVKKRARLDR